jgi:hypothetical protein
VDALGDRIHASAGQALLDELDDGFLKNVLAGLFRVVLATLARLDAGFDGSAGSSEVIVIAGSRPSLHRWAIMGRAAQ